MPYVDRQNRICGFLDIEDNENSGKFLRRYFILDTQANCLLWYMDNPQNLAVGAGAVGSLQLTYISKVSIATPKQKPKTPFCFVINALSQRYFLQANDQKDLKDWVEALNQASKITVPKAGTLPLATEVLRSLTAPPTLDKKPQVAYKTEIIGGVVVQTPISQNGGDGQEGSEPGSHAFLRRSQSYIPTSGCRPPTGPPLIKSGYCVKQGNVRKSWKRRFFALDDFTICYFKCEQDREPLRTILLKDVLKTHECLVKSGKLPSEFMVREVIQDLTRQCPIPSPKYSWTTKHTLLCLGTVHQLMDGKVDTFFVLHAIVSDAVIAGGVQVSPRDLLMRDNLFEIITTSRTFYVQADSPEDMRSWIQEIGAAVQALKCHPREPSFSRSVSLTRPGSSSLASGPNFILRRRPAVEEKRALCKAPSVASSWQPWTPVPQAGEKPLSAENAPEDSLFLPHPGESNATGVLASSRVRHRSEPQHPKEKPFVFNLDDENIRTSDV